MEVKTAAMAAKAVGVEIVAVASKPVDKKVKAGMAVVGAEIMVVAAGIMAAAPAAAKEMVAAEMVVEEMAVVEMVAAEMAVVEMVAAEMVVEVTMAVVSLR